jgi:hypothetical protein
MPHTLNILCILQINNETFYADWFLADFVLDTIILHQSSHRL